MQNKVLIIDQNPAYIEGICRFLSESKSISSIHQLNNVESIINSKSELINDRTVLILEIRKPIIFYQKIISKIISIYPDLKILCNGEFNDSLNLKMLYDTGCKGYFLKSSSSSEIILGVESIINGKYFFHSDIINNTIKKSSKIAKDYINITQRERELIYLISQQFSTKDIAVKMCLSTNSIDIKKRNLYHKTNTSNIAGLVHFAHINNLL
jgi:DNA-binding NarL/FixJ family response regulator